MKMFPIWSTFVFFGLLIILSGCRQKDQAGNLPSQSSDADSGNSSIAVSPDQTESGAGKQSKPPKLPKEKRVQQELEAARLSLFSVPLTDAAAKDRQEAWDRMAPPRGGLNGDQYQYACDILDRYSNAPPLEKLAFWQLFSIRIFYQSEPGIVRAFGGSGAGRQMTDEKLKATLYSALGKSPEDLPLGEAISEGYALLKQLSAECKRPSNGIDRANP
ncbi:MAG: hypothetical protein RLZZ245_2776 [Verrucomicrobiota bacterium]|jgi:hypothetical protein